MRLTLEVNQIHDLLERVQLDLPTIKRGWKDFKMNAKEACIRNQKSLDEQFLCEIWINEPELRVDILDCRRLPAEFLEQHWDDWKDRNGWIAFICKNYALSPFFIEQHWNRIKEVKDAYVAVLTKRKLPKGLIEREWENMSDDLKISISYRKQLPLDLSLDALKISIKGTTWDGAGISIIRKQKRLKQVPLDRLPEFLTSDLVGIRKWAQEKFEELTKKEDAK